MNSHPIPLVATLGVVPYTRGHHWRNVDAIRFCTSPGVLVARTRSGLFRLSTVRSTQLVNMRQAATMLTGRASDRKVIGGSVGSEDELENAGERTRLRVAVVVA